MVIAERAEAPARALREYRWRGHAFGVDIEAPIEVPTVRARSGDQGPRRVSLELVSPESLERAWRPQEASNLVDLRFEDGRSMLSVSSHGELGYRVWAPFYGRHVISLDGRRIRSALPRLSAWRWQRLFCAQVLPLSAALQKLELFHASAVAIAGRAVAFVAPSGTGKTSVATHAVARGAQLVTDDVLALEMLGEGVWAHPGAGFVNIDALELAAMSTEGRRRFGRVLGRSDKVHLAADVVDESLPLALIYFLRRDGRSCALAVHEVVQPATRALLGSSFLAYLRPPERLVHHLETCARLAESIRMFQVELPPSASAPEAADAILAHARTALEPCP